MIALQVDCVRKGTRFNSRRFHYSTLYIFDFKNLEEEEERQAILKALYADVAIKRTPSNAVVYCKDIADASIF